MVRTALAMILVVGCVACNSDDTSEGGGTTVPGATVSGATVPAAAAPTGPTIPAVPQAPADAAPVGATVQSGDLLFRLEAIENPMPPGEFLQPEPGTTWISFDMTASNTTDQPVPFSGLLATKLFDTTGRELQAAITDRGLLDGEFAPNQTKRGYLTYTVPDGAIPSYLQINAELFGGEAVNFVAA